MWHPNLKTGGGPPVRRNAHVMIGGLPRGQSSDVNVTWVPSMPDLPIEQQPTHPQVVYPFPTPGRQTASRRIHPSGPVLGPTTTERVKDRIVRAGEIYSDIRKSVGP